MGWFSKCPLALGVSATLLAGSLLTTGTALAATKTTDFDHVLEVKSQNPSTRGTGHMRTRDFIVGTVAIVILVAVTRWVALSILYHRT
jgi:hypothetical protein